MLFLISLVDVDVQISSQVSEYIDMLHVYL